MQKKIVIYLNCFGLLAFLTFKMLLGFSIFFAKKQTFFHECHPLRI